MKIIQITPLIINIEKGIVEWQEAVTDKVYKNIK